MTILTRFVCLFLILVSRFRLEINIAIFFAFPSLICTFAANFKEM